jgi:hypothetical protein
LDYVAEVMFLVGEWPWELKISLFVVLKNDFSEVEEAKFQGVERPYEIIFCILWIENATLVKSL